MAQVIPGEEHPLLCESCLGSNPFVRMIKMPNGAECKISKRPFTAFRWKPSKEGYKSTVISYTVAAQKNICQSCMTDLTYGLPVQIRDAFLRTAKAQGVPGADALVMESMPLSRVGQDYQHNLMLANQAMGIDEPKAHGVTDALRAMAQGAAQVATSQKAFAKHLPALCPYWIEGGCSKARDNQCALRPCCGALVIPELRGEERKRLEADLQARGAIAVALSPELRAKLRHAAQQQPPPSGDKETDRGKKKGRLVDDEATSTLVATALPKACREDELLDEFSKHGEVVRVSLTQGGRAFVEFARRADASAVVAAGPVVVRGSALRLAWAKKKLAKDDAGGKDEDDNDDAAAAAAPPASTPPQRDTTAKEMLPPPGLLPGQAMPPPPQALLDALAHRAKRLKA